jgi:hypothetical protein
VGRFLPAERSSRGTGPQRREGTHLRVVLKVPVDFRHGHQPGNIPLKCGVVCGDGSLDRVVIACDARVLTGEKEQSENVISTDLRSVLKLGGRIKDP